MGCNRQGAVIQYCSHDGVFVADLYYVAGATVVRASDKVTPDNLIRDGRRPTHHLTDHPYPYFWRPDLGVFVVPHEQCKEVVPT